ncbi:MAG: MMPL family transporter [Deltaproteobacteria bacterium]|nr:MMPL family transporter [Deltaproteobacteria bacterium]
MMFTQFLTFGLKHRLITFLLLTAITCLAAWGIPKLRVDTGFGSLISASDPDLPIYNKIAREFGSDNRTIVYVRDPDLWTPDKLAALEDLHYALEELDFVERVDDLFSLRSIRGKGGKIDSRIFLPEAPKDQKRIDQARTDALYNPLIVGNFISTDGNVTALMVSVREDTLDDTFDRRASQAIDGVLGPARSVFQQVFQVGPPRINAELKKVLFDDLRLLAPLSALVLALAILFFLRSFFAALIPLITSALSLTWTFGMMAWAGIPMNILCAMLPSLIIVIGSTEDTHMISTYFRGLSEAQEDHRAYATRFMMKHMGVPLVLTILTTAMGFASNIFSNIGLIKDFAMASTFAILANGIITILFVPMVLSLMGPRRTRLYRNQGEGVTGLPGLFVRIFGFTKTRFPRSILLLTAVLCAFFVFQLSKINVTNDPLSYFKQDRSLIQDTKRIHEDLSGMKVFFVTLESDSDKAFLDPGNIKKLVSIQNFLEKQRIFDRSISLADHLSLVNREFHGGDKEYLKVPKTRELVAQYLLFFHRRDLESYVSHDLRRANIVVRHNVSDSNTLNSHIRELKEVVSDISGNEMKAYVVGENLMVNAASENLMIAQVRSLVILLCVIFLIMSAMFTSFKGGLISLIPNMIPITLMFGVMGYFGIPLNPGTAMVSVIAIGIAIDGTIHLFSRYNDLCRRTSDYGEAVQITVQEEATPMVATYLALALGFGILLQSNFTLIAQFGALSAATMIFALFANLLITPIVMSRIRLVGLYQILSLSMHKDVLEKSSLFQGMSNYQVRKAIVISELSEFAEGELLVEQGTFGRSMFLILSGEVEVARRSDGKSQRITLLGPGQVFGEIGYIKEIHRTADVRALSPVEALRFDYRKLKKDLKFFPHIVANLNFNISVILGERLASAMEAITPQAEKEPLPESSEDEDNTG